MHRKHVTQKVLEKQKCLNLSLNKYNLKRKGQMKSCMIISNRGNFVLKYFNDFNAKSISDTKELWKAIKLFFSNKVLSMNHISGAFGSLANI